MSGPTRVRIDRLVLDGLPPGTRPAEVEVALRRELVARLRGVRAPASRKVASLDAPTAPGVEAAAASIATTVRGIVGGGR
jgi:hypothetical protein